MRVVFCGIQPGIGTSANMQAFVFGLRVMWGVRARQVLDIRQFLSIESEEFVFFDAGRIKGESIEQLLHSSDVIVLNISQAGSGLKQFYLNHRLVHSNLLLLVGKYHQNTQHELKLLERQYRIESGRICAMPYNMRFQKAYKNGSILSFLEKEQNAARSLENEHFLQELQKMLQRLIRYSAIEKENYLWMKYSNNMAPRSLQCLPLSL